jgi:hypothetical protein
MTKVLKMLLGGQEAPPSPLYPVCRSTGMRWARLTKTEKIGTARFKENYFYRLKSAV